MQEPRNGTGVVLAYEAGNHLHRYGGKVYADGRYELFSTSDTVHPPRWTSYEPFTREQVEEISRAVRELDALPEHIAGSDPPPPDAAKATFKLDGRTITVDEWPKAAPELEDLLATIARLRRKPPVASTWRLWSEGAVVELEAGCDIGELPVLSRLRDALFMDTGTDAAPAAALPPDGTPLVSVRFGDERLTVYGDGRQVTDAGETRLGTERVNAIRAALAETDWAALPSRLC
jgi:hypothetical protein